MKRLFRRAARLNRGKHELLAAFSGGHHTVPVDERAADGASHPPFYDTS